MKKIPNLFARDWAGNRSRVLPIFNTEADVIWVIAGEGVPTVKWDGSAVLVLDGKLYVRYDAKRGKTPPPGFEPCQDEDPVTGHRPGWIPAEGNPAAKWHVDAWMNSGHVPAGTYEACGPQHQSNPYGFPRNILIRHGADKLQALREAFRRTCVFRNGHPADVHAFLSFELGRLAYKHPEMPQAQLIEGIVFHHPDGRMVKVLAGDLGVAWKAKMR